MMRSGQHVLLNPGPVNVSPRVRRALIQPDICHREDEFGDVLVDTRRLLTNVFGIERTFTPAILTGSGTCALESAVIASVSRRGRLLVIDNGVYGDRIARIAGQYGIRHVRLTSPITEPPNLEQLARMLARDKAVETVAMVHHETSSGLLNPLAEVGRVVKRAGRLFLVDAISSMGAETIDWSRDGIDLAVGVSGKCLHGYPGLGIVLVRKSCLKALQKNPARSFYLHLPETLKAQDAGTVPFTPAVQLFFALRQALRELREETVDGRIARYRDRAALLRRGFDRLELEPLIAPERQSHVLTALKLPRGLSYQTLHNALKTRGFVIYAGQGALAERIFRIANMGEAADAVWPRLLAELRRILTR